MMDPRKPLETILLHTASDCIPWEHEGFSTLGGSDLANRYKEWLTRFHLEECRYLCFLDVTLVNFDRTQFYGILMAPDDGRWEVYRQAVEKLNTRLEGSRTVGSHEVFQAGLPVFRNPSSNQPITPQTREQLRKWLRKGVEIVSDGFLYWQDPSSEDCRKDRQKNEEAIVSFVAKAVSEEDFGHPSHPIEFSETVRQASEYKIEYNWQFFIQCLTEVQAQLTNAQGEPLSVVLGLPLSYVIYNDRSPNLNLVAEFISVAQIFIGMGGPPTEAEKKAKVIAKSIALREFRSNAVARAEFMGRSRARGNITHRLPATLMSMIKVLERDQDRLKLQHGDTFEIPAQCYLIYMLASIEQGFSPRWPKYEELYRNGTCLAKVLKEMWETIAVPVGDARVELDKEAVVRTYYYKVNEKPIIEFMGENIQLTDEECAALLSLCCILLIEAFQHSLIWSILDYEGTHSLKQAKVILSLEENHVVIKNPFPRHPSLEKSRGGQRYDIESIERLSHSIWTVKYPDNPQSLQRGEMWEVKISRHLCEEGANV